MAPSFHSPRKAGFTLAEILLAMMVFAIAITTILGLLARSIETADSILIKDEAISLSSAVDEFMAQLPFYDPNEPLSSYTLVRDQTALFAYKFRANQITGNPLTPHPIIAQGEVMGVNYLVVPKVREEGNTELTDEIEALDGRMFLVKIQPSEANPFGKDLKDPSLSNPNDTDSNGLPVYDSAVLVVFAEFFQVPPSVAIDSGLFSAFSERIKNKEVSPVFSFNFAVRR